MLGMSLQNLSLITLLQRKGHMQQKKEHRKSSFESKCDVPFFGTFSLIFKKLTEYFAELF